MDDGGHSYDHVFDGQKSLARSLISIDMHHERVMTCGMLYARRHFKTHQNIRTMVLGVLLSSLTSRRQLR
jgi:hypothetical protein